MDWILGLGMGAKRNYYYYWDSWGNLNMFILNTIIVTLLNFLGMMVILWSC